MIEYNFDGKPHIINDKYGYICFRTPCENFQTFNAINLENQLYLEYIEYLINNKSKDLENILLNIFMRSKIQNTLIEKYNMIYKPSYMIGQTALYGTLVLKFERIQNDNIGY